MLQTMLVHMPFSDFNRPSLGLGLLKAGLTRAGISCDVAYLNIRFAGIIGRENYMRIDNFSAAPLLGEWVFSEALVGGESLPGAESYYNVVLRPALLEPFAGNEEAFQQAVQEPELFDGLLALRARARQFVTDCFGEYNWGQYDIVGFGTTFQQNVAALALARRIKTAFPNTIIAFGGANCEGKMGVTLHRLFPFVDVVCSGEGDRAFIEYAKAYADGTRTPLIDGIIQRSGGKTLLPPALTNSIRDMDNLPIPDYSDFFQQCGVAPELRKELRLPVESSRGCWWGEKSHCTFCGLNGGTMTFRTKSADRFLGEVRALIGQYGVRDIAAADNIIDMHYFQTVLPRLSESDLGVRIFYETKANLQPGQVELLRESGVTHIQPGIESLSTKVLSLMRKGVHAYQNIRLLRLCAEYLVQPSWNVLAGFPGEDPSEYEAQAKVIPFLYHLTPPIFVGCIRLDRFSPLFERSVDFGLTNVRPAAAYGYIYPFEQRELADLAYYFEFDYEDGRRPVEYLAPLHAAVNDWKREHAVASVLYLDNGVQLQFASKRNGSSVSAFQLSGWERIAYRKCEDGSTAGAIFAAVLAAGYRVDRAELDGLLDRLVRDQVVLAIDDRYLGIAVGGNFRLKVLGESLKAGREVPEDVARAVRQLFELHPGAFADHLAVQLN